jgi:hypothetical protein
VAAFGKQIRHPDWPPLADLRRFDCPIAVGRGSDAEFPLLTLPVANGSLAASHRALLDEGTGALVSADRRRAWLFFRLLFPAAVKIGVQRDIASLGTWKDRDRLLLVVKRRRIRFRVLLCELMLLGHMEVRDHLPPIEGRPVSLQVTDDGKLIAEDCFAGLQGDEAVERLLLLLNRGGCDVGCVGEISDAVGEVGF